MGLTKPVEPQRRQGREIVGHTVTKLSRVVANQSLPLDRCHGWHRADFLALGTRATVSLEFCRAGVRVLQPLMTGYLKINLQVNF